MIDEKPKIMIIDDTPENLKILELLLFENNYKVYAFPSGKMAIQAAEMNPPDLVLLDINMPNMNGFDVCRVFKSKEKLNNIPIIFLTAMAQIEDKITAFEAGGVDYITKPFNFAEVLARIKTHLKIKNLQHELIQINKELNYRVKMQIKEIADSQMAAIVALANLAETRDNNTGKHIENVQELCLILAKELAKEKEYEDIITEDFIKVFYYTAALHDIGKVGIEDKILLKPGKLTEEEFEIMKTHTVIGAKSLLKAQEKYPNNKYITAGIQLTLSHHEKWDGSGYPKGLSGEAIPLESRILAVADSYDTLRNERVYKPAYTHAKSVELILKDIGTHFDPTIMKVFKRSHKKFDDIYK